MSRGDGSGGLLVNIAAAALPMVGSFVVSILLAPHLGERAWGTYSLVLSVATLLLIVGKFGIHTATSRLLSEHEDAPGPWLRAGLQLRLAFTLTTAAVATVAAPWIGRSFGVDGQSTSAFALVGAVVVGASLYEFAGEALVGLRQYRRQLLLRLSYLVLRLIAVGVVRWSSLGVVAFLAGHSAGQLLPAAWIVLVLWIRTRGQTANAAQARRRTLELATPLAFSSASFLIYAHTDRLMLGWLHDTATVGQFAVARNVLDAALFPLVALSWSMRPALIRTRRSGNDDQTRSILADGLRLSTLYASASTALLGAMGATLLVGLYSSEYREAGNLIVWMLPLLVLRGLGAGIFPALVALDAQRAYARLMGVTAAANVAANLVLIPRFGARGAVVGTIVALLVLTIGGFIELRRRTGPIPWRDHLGAHLMALVSSAAVAGGLLLWDPRGRPLWALIAATAVAAAILLGLNLARRGLRLTADGADS